MSGGRPRAILSQRLFSGEVPHLGVAAWKQDAILGPHWERLSTARLEDPAGPPGEASIPQLVNSKHSKCRSALAPDGSLESVPKGGKRG